MIRQLKSGDRIPEGDPRRYKSSHGYIRLRWNVAPGQLVEVYEHRVRDGVVVAAEEVHHLNGVKDDNRPENLAPLSSVEHHAHHRRIDRAEVVRLYLSGLTMPQVADRMRTDNGNICRILQAEGVPARRARDYAPFIDGATLAAAAQAPETTSAWDLARRFEVGINTIYRLMREHSIPPFPAGRPKQRRSA